MMISATEIPLSLAAHTAYAEAGRVVAMGVVDGQIADVDRVLGVDEITDVFRWLDHERRPVG
jgi:hypothetical protein